MTVNETAHDLPPLPDSEDDVDHPRNLEVEATAINQNFAHQVRPSVRVWWCFLVVVVVGLVGRVYMGSCVWAVYWGGVG